MFKRLLKVIGVGGTGAVAGVAGIEASGLTAFGLVGGGWGLGGLAIIFGTGTGALVSLAGWGAYKYIKSAKTESTATKRPIRWRYL